MTGLWLDLINFAQIEDELHASADVSAWAPVIVKFTSKGRTEARKSLRPLVPKFSLKETIDAHHLAPPVFILRPPSILSLPIDNNVPLLPPPPLPHKCEIKFFLSSFL